MDFHEALYVLNIEDYAEQIWHSNSHGELFFLEDYILLAEALKEIDDTMWFRPWFR